MTTTEQWDGVHQSYVPPATLTLDPKVRLHTRRAPVDPFLYEVLRYSLWNINDDLAKTIMKVSGSPIAYVAEDFGTSIMTETAEFVFFGTQIQTIPGYMDLQVKWILEHRSGKPGIHDGDMFLCNDPWVGTAHQQDVALTCPVFWEGELFCWVANALHQYDVGGTTPGGFCPDATDRFMEGVVIPPLKIVEGGELREDIDDFYVRHSRMPELSALDLRAQVAGNLAARERIVGLMKRYGPDVVKGAMYKIIEDAERVFAARIERLPDGVFRARSYLEAAVDGDRELYPICLQVEKSGSKLTFSMEGTAEQVGAMNITYAPWRSAILAALSPVLAYDILYAMGGPVRCMEFRPTAGTICCASHPASVSNGQGTQPLTGALTALCLARMMSFDPELAREIAAPGGGSTFLIDSLSGIDQWGSPYGTILLDPMLGATGGFTSRDGVDTGGVWYCPRSVSPNVEDNEQYFPILYLWRRELADSGGAGQFRGGNAGCAAFVAHGTAAIEHTAAAPGIAVPTSSGVFGGSPGSPSRFRLVTGTDVQAMLAARRMPSELSELAGESELVRPKQRGIRQTPDDVIEIAWSAGGGIGDPLTRDPTRVAEDVRCGATSAAWAARSYGVVLKAGEIDSVATDERRAAILRARIGDAESAEAGGSQSSDAPETTLGTGPWNALEVVWQADGWHVYHCGHCQRELTQPGEPSYKSGCLVTERLLEDAVPHATEAVKLVDPIVVVREYSCPGCGQLMAAEVARQGDPLLVDVELAPRRAVVVDEREPQLAVR